MIESILDSPFGVRGHIVGPSTLFITWLKGGRYTHVRVKASWSPERASSTRTCLIILGAVPPRRRLAVGLKWVIRTVRGRRTFVHGVRCVQALLRIISVFQKCRAACISIGRTPDPISASHKYRESLRVLPANRYFSHRNGLPGQKVRLTAAAIGRRDILLSRA